MTVTTVERSSLGVLHEIGNGGEGRVLQSAHLPHAVYKEFKPELAHELDVTGLENTIALLDRMSAADREFVERRTAWPHTIVADHGRFVGYLMPRVPGRFFCSHGPKAYPSHVDCKWDLLAYRERYRASSTITSDTANVSDQHVLAVMIELTKVVESLHRYDIILGDVSGRNMLWSVNQPELMVIDCDGFRANGTTAVTQPKQTPDWIDPVHGTETCIESDLYKVGLAMYRAYFSAELGLPGDDAPLGCDSTGRAVHELARRSVDDSDRPTASEWSAVLTRAARAQRLDGRPVIDLESVEKPRRPTPPAPVVRPTIDLGGDKA